jgi:hypothetical protein
VFVEPLSGASFQIKLPRYTTPAQIANCFGAHCGIPKKFFRIQHAGKLYANCSNEQIYLRQDDTVRMKICAPLRGGMQSASLPVAQLVRDVQDAECASDRAQTQAARSVAESHLRESRSKLLEHRVQPANLAAKAKDSASSKEGKAEGKDTVAVKTSISSSLDLNHLLKRSRSMDGGRYYPSFCQLVYFMEQKVMSMHDDARRKDAQEIMKAQLLRIGMHPELSRLVNVLILNDGALVKSTRADGGGVILQGRSTGAWCHCLHSHSGMDDWLALKSARNSRQWLDSNVNGGYTTCENVLSLQCATENARRKQHHLAVFKVGAIEWEKTQLMIARMPSVRAGAPHSHSPYEIRVSVEGWLFRETSDSRSARVGDEVVPLITVYKPQNIKKFDVQSAKQSSHYLPTDGSGKFVRVPHTYPGTVNGSVIVPMNPSKPAMCWLAVVDHRNKERPQGLLVLCVFLPSDADCTKIVQQKTVSGVADTLSAYYPCSTKDESLAKAVRQLDETDTRVLLRRQCSGPVELGGESQVERHGLPLQKSEAHSPRSFMSLGDFPPIPQRSASDGGTRVTEGSKDNVLKEIKYYEDNYGRRVPVGVEVKCGADIERIVPIEQVEAWCHVKERLTRKSHIVDHEEWEERFSQALRWKISRLEKGEAKGNSAGNRILAVDEVIAELLYGADVNTKETGQWFKDTEVLHRIQKLLYIGGETPPKIVSIKDFLELDTKFKEALQQEVQSFKTQHGSKEQIAMEIMVDVATAARVFWIVDTDQRRLFPVQLAAVAGALRAFAHGRKLLAQMNTGEGKTITLAVLQASIVLRDRRLRRVDASGNQDMRMEPALEATPDMEPCNYTVIHSVSSNGDLAKESTEETKEYYEKLLGSAPVNANAESGKDLWWDKKPDKHTGKDNAIFYGTISDFQKQLVDVLKVGTQVKQYRKWTKRQASVAWGGCYMLVDECDHVLVEQSLSVLFMSLPSSKHAAFDTLIQACQAQCDHNAGAGFMSVVNDSQVVKYQGELVSKVQQAMLKRVLENSNSLEEGAVGVMLGDNKDVPMSIFPPGLPAIENEGKRWDDSILAKLAQGALRQRAKKAQNDYVVDLDREKKVAAWRKLNVVIMDKTTGKEQAMSRWTYEGPFLECKHKLPVNGIEPLCYFSSVVSFIDNYAWVGGMTGTLGAAHCRRYLTKSYAHPAPITGGDAEKMAKACGLQLGGNGYDFTAGPDDLTKGLYAYTSGEYAGMAFFGASAEKESDTQTELSAPQCRPVLDPGFSFFEVPPRMRSRVFDCKPIVIGFDDEKNDSELVWLETIKKRAFSYSARKYMELLNGGPLPGNVKQSKLPDSHFDQPPESWTGPTLIIMETIAEAEKMVNVLLGKASASEQNSVMATDLGAKIGNKQGGSAGRVAGERVCKEIGAKGGGMVGERAGGYASRNIALHAAGGGLMGWAVGGVAEVAGEMMGQRIGEGIGGDVGEEVGGDVGQQVGEDVGGALGKGIGTVVDGVMRTWNDGSGLGGPNAPQVIKYYLDEHNNNLKDAIASTKPIVQEVTDTKIRMKLARANLEQSVELALKATSEVKGLSRTASTTAAAKEEAARAKRCADRAEQNVSLRKQELAKAEIDADKAEKKKEAVGGYDDRMPSNAIIVSTNKGGRGLDIANVCLFTITTRVMPDRQAVQARGRCGRSGWKGCAQLIVHLASKRRPELSAEGEIWDLQNNQDAQEQVHLTSLEKQNATARANDEVMQDYAEFQEKWAAELTDDVLLHNLEFDDDIERRRYREELKKGFRQVVEGKWSVWREGSIDHDPLDVFRWTSMLEDVHGIKAAVLTEGVEKLTEHSSYSALVHRIHRVAEFLYFDSEDLVVVGKMLLQLERCMLRTKYIAVHSADEQQWFVHDEASTASWANMNRGGKEDVEFLAHAAHYMSMRAGIISTHSNAHDGSEFCAFTQADVGRKICVATNGYVKVGTEETRVFNQKRINRLVADAAATANLGKAQEAVRNEVADIWRREATGQLPLVFDRDILTLMGEWVVAQNIIDTLHARLKLLHKDETPSKEKLANICVQRLRSCGYSVETPDTDISGKASVFINGGPYRSKRGTTMRSASPAKVLVPFLLLLLLVFLMSIFSGGATGTTTSATGADVGGFHPQAQEAINNIHLRVWRRNIGHVTVSGFGASLLFFGASAVLVLAYLVYLHIEEILVYFVLKERGIHQIEEGNINKSAEYDVRLKGGKQSTVKVKGAHLTLTTNCIWLKLPVDEPVPISTPLGHITWKRRLAYDTFGLMWERVSHESSNEYKELIGDEYTQLRNLIFAGESVTFSREELNRVGLDRRKLVELLEFGKCYINVTQNTDAMNGQSSKSEKVEERFMPTWACDQPPPNISGEIKEVTPAKVRYKVSVLCATNKIAMKLF